MARERGYFSVEHKRELERLGFGRSQQIVPTLVIPVHGVVAGEDAVVHPPARRAAHQGRPRRGSTRSRPAGRWRSTSIRACGRTWRTPAARCSSPRGSKKVDALISAGAQAVIGVVGVWNWRGRNEHDGLAMLPDWEWVALKEGRQVYVVYDSDIILKQPVALAMNRLGAALKRMGAAVAYTRLPSGDGGEKVGADDFLAAGHTLDDIVRLSSVAPPEPPSTSLGPLRGS